MPGLAPGAVVGGRYVTHRLLGEHGGAQSWVATDGERGPAVVLVTVPDSHPQALAVLDAANRARGVDNSRLVRIEDVGRAEGFVYFAEESLDGGASLSQLAARGGLDAAEVRRLTGEAALALDAGQARGLHHLSLTPDSLVRMPDGSVRVAGLATQAALAGHDHIGGPRALRRDAQGLVALAYAGLTGRWPHGATTGLEPAPRVFGRVPRPSEIAVGVPADLDTICHQSLSEGLGPSSPADYAAQIAPWAGMPRAGQGTGDEGNTVLGADSGSGQESGADSARPERTGLENTGPENTGPGRTGPETEGPGAAMSRQPAEPTTALPIPLPATTAEPTQAIPLAEQPEEAPEGERAAYDESDVEQTHPRSAVAGAATAAAAAGAATAGVVKAGAGAVGSAAGAVGARIAGFGKAATGRAGSVLTDRRTLKRAQREDEQAREVSIDQAPADTGLEPPAPLLPAEAGAPPSPVQRRVVLALFAALVFVAGGLGAMGASRIGSHTRIGSILGDTGTHRTTSHTSSSTTAAGDSASGTPIAISAATGFDPQGDGNENNALAAKVFDEDPASYWQTEGYQGPNFGGLKSGVGVLLDMGQVVTPRKVVLVRPTPASFDLYLGNEQSLDGATKIGSSPQTQGSVTIDTTGAVSGQFLMVWFTNAPRIADGSYRATLAEVSVYG